MYTVCVCVCVNEGRNRRDGVWCIEGELKASQK